MNYEPPLWSFAFLALLAIDPSFDLGSNVTLACVRCRASFNTPVLKTLGDCLSRVSPVAVADIIEGLKPTCRWTHGASSVQDAVRSASASSSAK